MPSQLFVQAFRRPIARRRVWRVLAASVSVLVAAAQGALRADQVKLDVSLAYPVMQVDPSSSKSSSKNENHLRIALTGFELPQAKQRSPVNVAVVIDSSGSMGGTKIEHAKRAAAEAVGLLHDSDIVSVITYADSFNVLVPATKASDRALIQAKINSIRAGGGTALFAGVAQGASEIRKFMGLNT